MRRVAAVLALAGAVAEGGEKEPPTVVEVAGVKVECRDLAVVGVEDGREVWTIRHPSLFKLEYGTRRVVSPVAAGGKLYYGVGSHVLVVDPVEGQVVRRVILNERVKGITPEGMGVVVTVQRREGWNRPETEYSIQPGRPDPALFLSASLRLARAPRLDAQKVSSEYGPPLLFGGTGRPRPAENAVPTLTEQAERDPTNPFWWLVLGERHFRLGRKDAAREAFEKVLGVEDNSHIFLLRASGIMENCGFTDLAEKAFEAGYRVFLESGHEPELFASQLGFAASFGHPGYSISCALKAGDLDRADKVMERSWKLAPLLENAHLAFDGMADRFEAAGRADDAKKWRSRARTGWTRFAPGGGGASRAILIEQMLNALEFGLLLYFLFLCIKYYDAAQRKEAGKKIGLHEELRTVFCTTRPERASLLILCVLYFVVGAARVPAVRAAHSAREIDPAAQNGSWGSPEAVAWWKRFAVHDEGRELYALSLVQAGGLNEAEGILKTLARSPQAQNNLGVTLCRKGQDGEARAAFEAAVALDPGLPEAKYNLGREAHGPRVERARKYLPGRKLLAVPTFETFGRAARKGRGKPGQAQGTSFFAGAFRFMGDVLIGLDPVIAVAAALLGVGSLALLFLPHAVARVDPYGTHWWLSLAVPGTHTRYAPLGVIALVGYLCCGFIRDAYLPFVSVRAPASFYGVSAGVEPGWDTSLPVVTKVLAYAIPFLSAAGLLLLRRVRPKPRPEGRLRLSWQIFRAAVFLALGVACLTLSAWWGPIPGAIFIASAVASLTLAVRERRYGRAEPP